LNGPHRPSAPPQDKLRRSLSPSWSALRAGCRPRGPQGPEGERREFSWFPRPPLNQRRGQACDAAIGGVRNWGIEELRDCELGGIGSRPRHHCVLAGILTAETQPPAQRASRPGGRTRRTSRHCHPEVTEQTERLGVREPCRLACAKCASALVSRLPGPPPLCASPAIAAADAESETTAAGVPGSRGAERPWGKAPARQGSKERGG
jgi:hypothetical protein